jgi:hypothetical protein
MRTFTIVLPFKLPTWNQLLAMNHWQRKKVRNWIHDAVLRCIHEGKDSQTQTEQVLKLSLTGSELQEYLSMIQPNSSKKYLSRKKSENQKKPESLLPGRMTAKEYLELIKRQKLDVRYGSSDSQKRTSKPRKYGYRQ